MAYTTGLGAEYVGLGIEVYHVAAGTLLYPWAASIPCSRNMFTFRLAHRSLLA